MALTERILRLQRAKVILTGGNPYEKQKENIHGHRISSTPYLRRCIHLHPSGR